MTTRAPPHVLVVGAGLSGLAAALALAELPALRITVAEARDRLGGRVEAQDGAELGAQWLGPRHERMLRLARDAGAELRPQYTGLGAEGRLTERVGLRQPPLPPRALAEITRFVALLDSDAGAAGGRRLDSTSIEAYIRRHVGDPAARDELLLFAQTVLACDPARVSFWFFLFYVRAGGGTEALADGPRGAQCWTLRGGPSRIIEHLGARLRALGVEVLLGKEVLRISDNVATLRGGDKLAFAKVIIAAPPLAADRITFVPPLPPERRFLARSMVPGRAIKVVLQYEDAFWLAPLPDAPAPPPGPLKNIFHAEVAGNPALVCLVTGPDAEALGDLPGEARRAAILERISTLYGTVPPPRAYWEKVWSHDRLAGGCFAGLFPPDGSFSRCAGVIAAPVGDVHWAATETAPEFYGYMEGAVRAGERAAAEVLHCLG